MSTKKELSDIFIGYLLEHGYPSNSLALAYIIDHIRRIDLAVIDPQTNLPIMLVAFSTDESSSAISSAKSQLKSFIEGLSNQNIPAYIVSSNDEEPFFDIVEINAFAGAIINGKFGSLNSLDFKHQRIARISEKTKAVEDDKRAAIYNFSKVSMGLAIAIFILFILKK